MHRTRFAPTPNGNLHLGHYLNLLFVHALSDKYNLYQVLRLEDRDQTRSTKENCLKVLRCLYDLGDLGKFESQMKNQSARMNRYLQIAETLIKENQVYACICSRKDIASAPQEGIVNHSICPGKCSTKDVSIHKENVSWRLQNQQNPVLDGLILRNRDKVFSFEFTSTVDDYDDGITHIIRGLDLLPAEERLNELRSFMFPLSPPLQFFYHPLLFESSLQKVSKSKGAKSLRAMLTSGWNLDSLTGYCAFLLGKSTALQPKDLNWWQANAVEMLVR